MSASKINDHYQKAISGDFRAEKALFGLLLERFRFLTHHKIGWNQDAEDVAQEALLVVSNSYRTLKVEKSFAAWTVKVLHNRILDFHDSRQRRLKREVVDNEGDLISQAAVEPDEGYLKLILIKCFRKLLAVNRQYGRVLNLRTQGIETDEICSKLKITRSNLYISLHRARTMLAECLRNGSIDK